MFAVLEIFPGFVKKNKNSVITNVAAKSTSYNNFYQTLCSLNATKMQKCYK